MKLRPENAPRTHCVRCNAPFDPAGVQVRATCSPCATDLRLLHAASEYTFFKRAYYIPSNEGATLEWLLANGWSHEVRLPYAVSGNSPMVQVSGSMVKVPMVKAPSVDKVLVNSS